MLTLTYDSSVGTTKHQKCWKHIAEIMKKLFLLMQCDCPHKVNDLILYVKQLNKHAKRKHNNSKNDK